MRDNAVKPISTLIVKPALPKALQGLEALAYNLRWAWDPDTIDLFRRIDPVLWETAYHNPVRMIHDIGQERLDQLSKNPGFMAHFKRVSESLRAFMDGDTYFHTAAPPLIRPSNTRLPGTFSRPTPRCRSGTMSSPLL